MSGKRPTKDDDDSIWGDVARMEAEVVDPEEEATAHYDANSLQKKLAALDPEAAEMLRKARSQRKKTALPLGKKKDEEAEPPESDEEGDPDTRSSSRSASSCG